MSGTPFCTLCTTIALLTASPLYGIDLPEPMATEKLAAAFAAAGFQQAADNRWIRCEEDPPTLSYAPGRAEVTDINGDGNPEVWITESSVFCYGYTGNAFVLLTRDGDSWRVLLDKPGMQRLLETRYNGWPDIEIGGPGFSKFPVYRWNGNDYQQQP